MAKQVSTGLNGLDNLICNLHKGDNVVWQVNNIEDYRHFVRPFIEQAIAEDKEIVYLRFAQHPSLIEGIDGSETIDVYSLDATLGFESFTKQMHSIISRKPRGAFYVFDSLSDLLSAWATDLMIGNFFMVTCPYLFELDTVAYFAIFRDYHSFQTVARIRETTQLLLDVYNFDGYIYVHPLKVWNRYSPTMFLPHIEKEDAFTPITNSMDTTKLFTKISETTQTASTRTLDYWDRLFMRAERLTQSSAHPNELRQLLEELCRLMIGRERRISKLAQENFSLEDLINIKKRMIGTGYIGGKAAGMLLAQKIISNDRNFDWNDYIEPHDSFYIASDVFYSYIVENGWWKLFMEQKTKNGYFKVADQMKENLLKGKFPSQIRERFQEIIEYFGQSPIIIRSSSLLEDSFGNAFAGKYESIFLVNQGDPEQRYLKFEEAVRRIYASTMNESALTYRLERGLDQQDEQMALLVQRVSGSYKNHYFFPDLAGVGISHNTFVWKPELDPKAGMLRMVLGMGTRAVDRVEDDYPQTIALDQPLLRPYSSKKDKKQYSQNKVDLLDIEENRLKTTEFTELLKEGVEIQTDLVATLDRPTQQKLEKLGMNEYEAWILTFEKLLSDTNFPKIMQRMLKLIEEKYQYPVDLEYTINFDKDNNFRVNIVQCRPLQTKGIEKETTVPEDIAQDRIFFKSQGYNMGGNISQPVSRVIYIDPKKYLELPVSRKYSIARLVGKLNKQIMLRETTPTILMGPGRWGTTTPSLGVPVNFSEINKITALVEIAYEGGNLMPDLSFGTHFFHDLVETDIFYVALFPHKNETIFDKNRLFEMENCLTSFCPEDEKFEDVVRVCDFESNRLQLISNLVSQKVICFVQNS
jgi:hypothetical protein